MKNNLYSGKVVYLSTYPPTECGIATFTQDLAWAVAEHTSTAPAIISILQGENDFSHPQEVELTIRKNQLEDYIEAAHFANQNADVISVQHEYGIFGGKDGEMILRFLEHLEKPVVVTLHTILYEPTYNQRKILSRIGQYADRVVCMNSLAIPLLEKIYGIPREKIEMIHHGAPSKLMESKEDIKNQLGLQGKIVLSTFGLINRGKGIEYAIEALPRVVKKFPNVIYLILGATHPEVKKREGERYRKYLENMVAELGLEKHVRFVNQYLTKRDLIRYLMATDIYITPYLNPQQVVSGTLAYAMHFGKVIISTPYLYAKELLRDGRGIIVDFRDSKSIEEALWYLLSNPWRRYQIERKARIFGEQLSWSNVGKEYARLFDSVSSFLLAS
jgi:glycosyltransferase involved in cell wall biosynthesis